VTELVSLYKDSFLPAYGDVVAYLGDKPPQLLSEIENTLSHLMVAVDDEAHAPLQEENLKKAKNHLIRATLDAYKLLWATMMRQIDDAIKEGGPLAFNMSRGELERMRKELIALGTEARNHELQNVGRDPGGSMERYARVIETAKNLMDRFDPDKLEAVREKRWSDLIREQKVGFILGVVASLLASSIWGLVFGL
jgi:hypothetical protein